LWTSAPKASFKVQELYEHNLLVAVADVPKDIISAAGGGGSIGKKGPPSQNGLVKKEKIVRAESSWENRESGWFKKVKTRVLLLARPPLGLLK